MGYNIVLIFLLVSSCVPLAASKGLDGGNQCGAIPHDGIPTHILLKLLAEESAGKISESVLQLERRIATVINNATSNFQYSLHNLSSQVYALQHQNQELTCDPTTSIAS